MKQGVIVAIVASLVSLGGTRSLEAAPASTTKSAAAAPVVPAKAIRSKKKVHRASHVKKHRTVARSMSPAK